MRYLKPYKLFESTKSNPVDTYIDMMGATKDDINDIFISFLDQGYKIEYGLGYKDEIGRVRGRRTTNYEIPILKVKLKNDKTRYFGGSTKFKDLNYIENLYHGLSRFSGMYKDKLEKITYELHSNAEMTINCYFKPEEDESIITIPFTEVADAIKESIERRFGHAYLLRIRNQSNKELHLDVDLLLGPDDEDKLIDKLQNELKKDSTKNWASNYNTAESASKAILKVLESDLSKKFGMKIFFSHTTDSLNRAGMIDGIYTHDYSPDPNKKSGKVKLFEFTMSLESRYHRYNIKKGFFRQRTIELEIYETIEIKLRLI